MFPILWFLIALIIGTTLLFIITTIIANKKLIHDIKPLWSLRKPLESFVRPNHRYSYQFDTYKHQFDETNLIDDKTYADLNLKALFDSMNFNFTAIGEMRLYATLRKMFTIHNQMLIQKFKNDELFRLKISTHLAKIGKAIYPTFPDQLTTVKRNHLYMLTTYLPLVFLLFAFLKPEIGILLTILVAIFNMILSGVLKRTFDQDLNSLFYTSNVIKKAYAIHKIDGAPTIDVDFSHFKVARRLSGLLGRVNTAEDSMIFAFLLKAIFMLDYHIFHLIQHSFKKYEAEVMACYEYIGSIDNHYAIALWRETLTQYALPQASNDDSVEFEALTHPLLVDAISNDLVINSHILLTGSNSSGKSTFMKAIALNLLLAQTINTVTAKYFKYKPGLIFTSMVNQDDILSGDSYFMTEIKSIKRLFDLKTEDKIYCFIDEIFKGTNTTERIAASESVLNYLGNSQNYEIIAATHDIELATLLEYQYKNFHFNETIYENEIAFDFKIKPGKADTRNAIELLRILKFPNQVYTRAKTSSNQFL